MSGKNWLPLNSSDPAVNAAIACVLALVAIMLVVVGGIFLLPIVAAIGIAKIVHWYANRPTPTDQLYAQAQTRGITANFPDGDQYLEAFIDRFLDACGNNLPVYPLYSTMVQLAKTLYEHENLNNPLPPVAPAGTIEEGRYRDQLIAYQKKTSDAPATLQAFNSAISTSFFDLIAALPPMARTSRQHFIVDEDVKPLATFPLVEILPKAAPSIQALMLPFFREKVLDLSLFQDLRKELQHNTDVASCLPVEFKGDAKAAVATYLAGTPLQYLFETPIPFAIPEAIRFSGHWIVAPPGRGKTTLLQAMVKEDLARDAAIVVMDSKGDLIEPLKNLATIKDRLVLIEPTADAAFALNPLDVGKGNAIHAVNLIEYVMAGLLDAKFTALQSALFRNVVPAIIDGIQNPTLDTFKQVMVHGLPADALGKLSPHAREFFSNRDTGFDAKTYDSTRKEVVWRLDYLLSNPVLRAMFSAAQTKLDMSNEIDAGRVIIINNSKAILGDEGAEFFGRFFIALIHRAAQQRAGKPVAAKKPCFVYIDECQSVIGKDAKIPTLLDECRSQKIALILAHQRTAQLSTPVLDAVANCAVRMANSDDDAKYLAPKLRMDAEALQALPRGTFGTFVRDLTTRGIALTIGKVELDRLPRMTAADIEAVHDRMQANFSTRAAAPTEDGDGQVPADPGQASEAFAPPADPKPQAIATRDTNDPGEPAARW